MSARRPLRALHAHYLTVWRASWAARATLAGPRRNADELAFLPAALALQETPLHPAPRIAAWLLMTLAALALLWACIGEVDIVAVAPGRIIVSDRTKTIQPLETSIVRRVLVQDGQAVHAGQVLIELDATIAAADTRGVLEQGKASAAEIQRTQALLRALGQAHLPEPALAGNPGERSGPTPWGAAAALTPVERAGLASQLQAEWHDIRARLARFDAEQARRGAETTTVQAMIAKLEATLPLARTREADFERLVRQGYISTHATQDKTRERIELERDLALQRARLVEAHSALEEAVRARAAWRAETMRALNDRQAMAVTRLAQLQAEAIKADQRQRQTVLVAPVAGIVQQLAVPGPGAVVTAAQPLLIVVPTGSDGTSEVAAEAALANLDSGFVRPGQSAELKLETFPYTRYGTVAARVSVVGADAIDDHQRGAYYPVKLTLARHVMDIDGTAVRLAPGMNLSAEIRLGRRRIIDYLLSPIRRAGSESLRER